MNCREFQFYLDEYAMGRLGSEQRIPMDAHRSSCAACEKSHQQETALRTQLREMPLAVPTYDLWNQVAAQISQPVVSARSLWKRWTAAALVPAVSFAALAFFLVPRTPQAPAFPENTTIVVTQASHEEKVVNNVLDMRRMDVADRDGLIEETLLAR